MNIPEVVKRLRTEGCVRLNEGSLEVQVIGNTLLFIQDFGAGSAEARFRTRAERAADGTPIVAAMGEGLTAYLDAANPEKSYVAAHPVTDQDWQNIRAGTGVGSSKRKIETGYMMHQNASNKARRAEKINKAGVPALMATLGAMYFWER